MFRKLYNLHAQRSTGRWSMSFEYIIYVALAEIVPLFHNDLSAVYLWKKLFYDCTENRELHKNKRNIKLPLHRGDLYKFKPVTEFMMLLALICLQFAKKMYCKITLLLLYWPNDYIYQKITYDAIFELLYIKSPIRELSPPCRAQCNLCNRCRRHKINHLISLVTWHLYIFFIRLLFILMIVTGFNAKLCSSSQFHWILSVASKQIVFYV